MFRVVKVTFEAYYHSPASCPKSTPMLSYLPLLPFVETDSIFLTTISQTRCGVSLTKSGVFTHVKNAFWFGQSGFVASSSEMSNS